MTSFAKPEVHNVSATLSEKDWAPATGKIHKNVVKFGRVVFELCKRTDRHTLFITMSRQVMVSELWTYL